MSERDTHFVGFARLLMKDLLWDSGGFSFNVPVGEAIEKCKVVIAQRAYDLVEHALENTSLYDLDSYEEQIKPIPDMTEWPKE
jgi:hypothetical protein